MGNAGSMDQHPDLRGHNLPLKLPMPDPGELEERFAIVLVRQHHNKVSMCVLCPTTSTKPPLTHSPTRVRPCPGTAVRRSDPCSSNTPHWVFVVQGRGGVFLHFLNKVLDLSHEICICCRS